MKWYLQNTKNDTVENPFSSVKVIKGIDIFNYNQYLSNLIEESTKTYIETTLFRNKVGYKNIPRFEGNWKITQEIYRVIRIINTQNNALSI